MSTPTQETPPTGLTTEEVARRQAAGLSNAFALPTSRTYRQILRENVFTFINNVLFLLGLALVALGRPGDAIISVGVILVNVVVAVVQEVRAKRLLDRIALLTRPKATVIRDGHEHAIDPAAVVLGDLLVVRPGDQVVVDGVVRTPGPLEVDESLLTGESDRVVKGAGDLLYSGSFVVTGSGQYQATRVGAASFANTLTAGARAFRRVLTPLQRAVYLIIRILLLVVLYFEVLLLVNAVLSEVSLLESVQASVVIFGLVPNGLFLAITLAYAAGAVRVAGRGVLVQQANAIESLANVDVLCLDKTGTLTTNRLTLRALHPLTGNEEEFRQMLATFVASVTSGNRTSEAIAASLPGKRMRVVDEVPFSSERKWSGVVMATGAILVLGAPEVVLPTEAAMTAAVERWVTQGLRVVLLARAPGGALRDAAGQPLLPAGLEPLGLVVLADELRPGTQETLEQFAQAGVRLKIISGDNPETVAALARQAGFPGQLRLVTGRDLEGLTSAQLEAVAEEGDVFGRVVPQQKEGLVAALKRRGHHVAMIGDGGERCALPQAGRPWDRHGEWQSGDARRGGYRPPGRPVRCARTRDPGGATHSQRNAGYPPPLPDAGRLLRAPDPLGRSGGRLPLHPADGFAADTVHRWPANAGAGGLGRATATTAWPARAAAAVLPPSRGDHPLAGGPARLRAVPLASGVQPPASAA